MIPTGVVVFVDLPIGVERDGVVHSSAELRPITMRESMRASAAAAGPPEGIPADEWRGLHRVAAHVVRIGSIPREDITAAFLLNASDADVQALTEGVGRLTEVARTFRGGAGGPAGVGLPAGQGDRVA